MKSNFLFPFFPELVSEHCIQEVSSCLTSFLYHHFRKVEWKTFGIPVPRPDEREGRQNNLLPYPDERDELMEQLCAQDAIINAGTRKQIWAGMSITTCFKTLLCFWRFVEKKCILLLANRRIKATLKAILLTLGCQKMKCVARGFKKWTVKSCLGNFTTSTEDSLNRE